MYSINNEIRGNLGYLWSSFSHVILKTSITCNLFSFPITAQAMFLALSITSAFPVSFLFLFSFRLHSVPFFACVSQSGNTHVLNGKALIPPLPLKCFRTYDRRSPYFKPSVSFSLSFLHAQSLPMACCVVSQEMLSHSEASKPYKRFHTHPFFPLSVVAAVP